MASVRAAFSTKTIMVMNKRTELVSELRATLRHGLDLQAAEKVLHALQDNLLVLIGLYLSGGLNHPGGAADFSPEIVGLVTRADGSDLSERERRKVEAWLVAMPQVTEFSMSPLKPANSPEFVSTANK